MPNGVPNKGRILVLLVLALVVAVGAGIQTFRFDQQVAAGRVLEDSITQQLNATDLALGELRHAQSAYVAAGQGSAFWMNQFDSVAARVEGTLRDRQQTTRSAGALAHYDAAIEQLDTLRTSNARARNYVDSQQLILASDVIFVESLEIIGRISANVSAARDTEIYSARQALATATQYRQGLLAGSLLFTLLVGLIAYGRIGKVAPAEITFDVAAVAPAPVPEPQPVVKPAPQVFHAPYMADAADVCVDLARLLDGRDLPALLSRASAAIGADGLVLWVLDESGQTLRASLGHGYSDRMLKRLGNLPVSADNVTSLACRTLQPQVVPSTSAGVPGALAVPLISSTGCVGVLSAEVSEPMSEGHQLPVARLIAAQLSAVIRPDAASAAAAAH
jgi:hypothetical protein